MNRQVYVAIIGAGPAGMLLAHLLRLQDVSVLVLERRDRAYIESRVRAGVLEPGTVALLDELNLGERLHAEGLVHEGINLVCDDELVRIDLPEYTDGPGVTVYGQQEVMKDLLTAAVDRDIEVAFEAEEIEISGLDSATVHVSWRQRGLAETVECRFLAGCDGAHGITQQLMPKNRTLELAYPFGWLGILADVAPVGEELVYGRHERGFVLASMRSRTRSRYYVQCPGDTLLEDWSDERLWDEICIRLGADIASRVTRGAAIEKSITPLRGRVTEPMRNGRLFLAGDAAHLVPPTGAKGLNLAAADVRVLAAALAEHYKGGSEAGLRSYSAVAAARVWKAQRFSWWFTRLSHSFPDQPLYQTRLDRSEFDDLLKSKSLQRVFAENYVGHY
jgi:p-hydroxybenzoate 3-monooxygenase